MKWLKRILLAGAFLAILGLGAICVVLFSSGVQRMIAMTVLEQEVESLELEYLKVQPDFSGIEIKKTAFTYEGTQVALDSAVIEGELIETLQGEVLRLDKVIVSGLKIDATGATPSAEEGEETLSEEEAEALFQGFLEALELPFQLFVEQLKVDVEVKLADLEVKAALVGADIAPGQAAQFELEGELRESLSSSEVGEVTWAGQVTVAQTEARRLSGVSVDLKLLASGGSLPAPAELLVQGGIETVAGEESYSLVIRNGASAQVPPLASVKGQYVQSKGELSGQYSLQSTWAEFQPFVMGMPLPVGTVDGQGDFRFNVSAGTGEVKTQISVDGKNWGALDSQLTDLPPLQSRWDADFAFGPETVELRVLKGSIQKFSGEPMLAVALLKPFTLGLAAEGFDATQLEGELLTLSATDLPLNWLNPWLGDIALQGELRSLNLQLQQSGGEWQLWATQPLELKSLQVASAGSEWIDPWDIRVTPQLKLRGERLSAKLGQLRIISDRIPVLSMESEFVVDLPILNDTTAGAAGVLPQSAKTRMTANLAELVSQPIIGMNNLAAGDLELNYDYNIAAGGQLKLDGGLKRLVVSDTLAKINGASFQIEGSVAETGIDVVMPLKMIGTGGITDATISAKLAQEGAAWRANVEVKGASLATDNFTTLAAAFQKNSELVEAKKNEKQNLVTPVPGQPNLVAAQSLAIAEPVSAWHGFLGTVKVDLKELISGQLAASDVLAQLEVAPEAITLHPFQATYSGAPSTAHLVLSFDKSGVEPSYTVDSNFDVSGFDLGKFLSKDSVIGKPAIDGVYAMKGKLYGQSPDLAGFAEQLRGEMVLKGVDGRIRALAGSSSPVKQAGNVGGLAVGLLSTLAGDKVKELRLANELFSLLRYIDYDEIVLQVKRGDDLNLNIEQLLLAGPKLKLEGEGAVIHEPGISIGEQRLVVQTRLSAQGGVAELLNEARLLTANAGEDGYYPGPDFVIRGVASKPDFGELEAIVKKAALSPLVGNRAEKQDLQGRQNTDTEPETEPTPEPESAPKTNLKEEVINDVLKGLFGR